MISGMPPSAPHTAGVPQASDSTRMSPKASLVEGSGVTVALGVASGEVLDACRRPRTSVAARTALGPRAEPLEGPRVVAGPGENQSRLGHPVEQEVERLDQRAEPLLGVGRERGEQDPRRTEFEARLAAGTDR